MCHSNKKETKIVNIPYELLIRFAQGKTNKQEEEWVMHWIDESEENLNTFLDLKEEWKYGKDSTLELTIPDRTSVWEKIADVTGVSEQKEEEKKKGKRYIKATLSLAAFLLVFVVGWRIISYAQGNLTDSYITLNTDKGQKSNLVLDDGTKVWLNSESTLLFSNFQNSDSRMVKANGELYFDVFPNPHKAFMIDMGTIKIKVLGTSFNVSSYKDKDEIEIALFEGKIDVLEDLSDKHIVTLYPSQSVVINKRDFSYKVMEEDISHKRVWISNKLLIYNANITEVLKKIEHWYGVNVVYYNLPTSKSYTFILNTESLRECLDMFNEITPINYEIHDDYVEIKGK